MCVGYSKPAFHIFLPVFEIIATVDRMFYAPRRDEQSFVAVEVHV
jgi:hypothetical protein